MSNGRSLTNSENSHVLEQLQVICAAKKLTKRQLARDLGVAQGTISALSLGNNRAGYAFARTLAGYIGIAVEDLLAGTLSARPVDRYPNRDAVIACLGNECEPSAVAALRDTEPPDGKDASRLWWADALRFEVERAKRVRATVRPAQQAPIAWQRVRSG